MLVRLRRARSSGLHHGVTRARVVNQKGAHVMPKGGSREGAGRPRGSRGRRTKEAVAKAEALGPTGRLTGGDGSCVTSAPKKNRRAWRPAESRLPRRYGTRFSRI